MGKASRPKPARLADKLLRIRRSLGLSQTQMLIHLGHAERGYRSYISDFEKGKREPPLPVLLNYAQAAGVWVDVLINDELDLPKQLPTASKREGVKRKRKPKPRRK
jgi:transcriptional regulator with XRE-family HTH domain